MQKGKNYYMFKIETRVKIYAMKMFSPTLWFPGIRSKTRSEVERRFHLQKDKMHFKNNKVPY